MCPQERSQKFSGCTHHTGEEAARIGRRLVELELRGQKSLTAAFYHLEAKTGIGHRHWRDWWYGASNAHSVLSGTWDRLTIAYEVELATKLHQIQVELEHAKSLRRGNGSEGQNADQVD